MIGFLPLVFAAVGTILVVGSVSITGFIISKIEKDILKLETEILDCSSAIAHGDEIIQRSNNVINPADIKLLIIQTTSKKSDYSQVIAQVFKDYVQGITYRYSAAKGEGPSQEICKEWEAKVISFANGDAASLNELNDLSNALILEWVDRHNSIFKSRKDKEILVKSKKSQVARYRDTSITLQILGLIMVLLKDVAATQT